MKKRTKIIIGVILSFVAVLLISAATLVCMNWEIAKGVFSLLKSAPGNNLKAAWIFLTENSDGIETRLNENSEKYDDAVKNVLSDLNEQGGGISKEAVEALNSGLYTEEEMIRIITSGGAELEEINRQKQQSEASSGENGSSGKADADKVQASDTEGKKEIDAVIQPQNPDGASGSGNGAGTVAPPVSDIGGGGGKHQTNSPSVNHNGSIGNGGKDNNSKTGTDSGQAASQNPGGAAQGENPAASDDTAASVAKLYIIKSNFVSQLSSIEKEITSSYLSLPKEQQTPASRKSIAGEYISTVADLELECDAQVEAILSELGTKLEASSKDTSIIETIRQSYENEKSLKKAYYMDIYMNGLPKKNTSQK